MYSPFMKKIQQLGFIVTLEAGKLVWEKIPFKLFLISIGGHLGTLSLAAAVLALWRLPKMISVTLGDYFFPLFHISLELE